MLKEPNRSIMLWLVDILVDVAIESDKNGVDVTELGRLIILQTFISTNI